MDRKRWNRRTGTRIGDDDVCEPLPRLLGSFDCPISAKLSWGHLGQNPLQRRQWQALIDLWRSLGRPRDGFWQHIYVFYNRIVDSYAYGDGAVANDQGERRQSDVRTNPKAEQPSAPPPG